MIRRSVIAIFAMCSLSLGGCDFFYGLVVGCMSGGAHYAKNGPGAYDSYDTDLTECRAAEAAGQKFSHPEKACWWTPMDTCMARRGYTVSGYL